MESLFEFLRVFQVIFGIGLVIFVHELGHFIAARMCGVRVETFSIGMGPRLLSWKRGSTRYQLAAIPLGGFCRMAGEERSLEGRPPAPDELPAKSVGARFFIYSGGVLMNVAFGLVIFPILFQIGVPFVRPVLGPSDPGSVAWHARLPDGAEVLSVNGKEVIDFYDIASEVALGDPERSVLRLRAQDGTEREEVLVPEFDEAYGVASIGVNAALDRDQDGSIAIVVREDSAAAEAGLRTGDRLVAVEGGVPGMDERIQLAPFLQRAEPVVLRVAGEDGERTVTITPRLDPEVSPSRVGIAPVYTHLLDVREGPWSDSIDLRAEDRILSAQGRPLLRRGDLRRALLEVPGPLRLEVERGGVVRSVQGPTFSPEEALAFADDLFLTLDLEASVLSIAKDEPAWIAGLRDGDRVLEIDGSDVATWEDVSTLVGKASAAKRPVVFQIERRIPDGTADDSGARTEFLNLTATPAPTPLPDYGFELQRAQYVFQAASIGQAITIGTERSWKLLKDSWSTIKGILQGRVSAEKSVGGIITIGVFSYTLAEAGWVELMFFLCLLSINLAFINVLPIPVLDGGHLFFLIIEKIKGSPVSERILGYSQMVGVVLILSLMVYVTYNDLVRWVLSP